MAKSNRFRIQHGVFGILTALLLQAGVSLPAFAQEVHRFQINTTDAATAIHEFGNQSGVQILASAEALRGKRLNEVSGDLSTDDGLQRLLADTGLSHRYVGERAVALVSDSVVAGSDSSRAPSAPHAFNNPDPGTAEKKSFWSRFRLAQAETASRSENQTTSENSTESSQKRIELEEVVVTGTHIRRTTQDSSSLITYDRKKIDESGVASVEALLQKIPQNFSLVNSQTTLTNGGNPDALSNQARGTSVDLRGIGVGSTLVLLDGQRIAPSGQLGTFVDLSMLPLGAIDRVEILSDGASAIYGADAVAGVVNFVSRKNFQGAESTLDFGTSTRGGGRERGISQLLGMPWSGGHVMLALDYADDEGVDAAQRDFIPDQGGPYMLLPQQHRRTAYASLRQRVSSKLDAFASGIYSSRNYRQDYVSFGSDVNEFGHVRLSGGTAGLDYDFGTGWRAEVVGNTSKSVNFSDATFDGIPLPLGDFTFQFSSVDLTAEGPVISGPGGQVRASAGLGRRYEELRSDQPSRALPIRRYDATRYVNSAFAELSIPIVGKENANSWARRLELSLAGRYDHYDDFGSATTPKIGVVWAPLQSLEVRATYAKSFRAPTLPQLSSVHSYIALPATNPAGGPSIITLFDRLPGNSALETERSTSVSAGFQLRPASVEGLTTSATYFNIKYRNRIDTPPVLGSLAGIFLQADVLGSFINADPSLAEVQRIFNEEHLVNRIGAVPENVGAIFDLRLHNIGRTSTSGFDYSLEYTHPSGIGQFREFFEGTYLLRNDSRPSPASSTVDLVNTTFNPMALRFRTGLAWNRSGFGSVLIVNYSGHYKNDLLVPAGDISAWITGDLQLSYSPPTSVAGSVLKGLSVALNVQNITDEKPPYVPGALNTANTNLDYDATNASPLGRFISMNLRVRW